VTMKFRMKIVLGFLIFSSSYGQAAEISNSHATAKSSAILAFAATCQDKTWNDFVKMAKDAKFLDKPFKDHKMITTTDGVTFPDDNTKITVKRKNLIEAQFPDEIITGTDLCDLAVNLNAQKRNSAKFNFFMEAAEAAQLAKISESDKLSLIVLGGATVLWGIAFLSPPLTPFGIFIVGTHLLALSAVAGSMQTEDLLNKTVNSDFKLFCDDSTVTFQGDKTKILITKTNGHLNISIIDLKEGSSEATNFFASKMDARSLTMIKETAKNCNSPKDAEVLTRQFNESKKILKNRVAQLSADEEKKLVHPNSGGIR
jgi:hypothetical protein